MAYKMKGPSLYPNYGKAKKAIKLNREDTSTKDGRATSSPFQAKDEKKKATSTHFADGTKKSARDKFNDEENRKEQLLNQGFTPSDADSMIESGAVTGRVNPNDKPVKPTDADMKKYSDLENYDDDNPTGKAKPKKKKKK